MALDMDKLNAFVGQFVGDLGATVHAGMVVIGERLGLYKALAAQPMTPPNLLPKLKPMNATCANGSPRRPPVDMSRMTTKPTSSVSPKNRLLLSPQKTARHICLELSNWHWDRLLPFHESLIHFAPALEWAGTNTMTMSFTD